MASAWLILFITYASELAFVLLQTIVSTELTFIPSENELPYLLAIWSAKESMYKAYGKKEVDFKDHMQICEFNLKNEGNIEANFLLVSNFKMIVYYRWTGEYMYTWTAWQSIQ